MSCWYSYNLMVWERDLCCSGNLHIHSQVARELEGKHSTIRQFTVLTSNVSLRLGNMNFVESTAQCLLLY